MSLFRNFEFYKEEIELAFVQNAGVEIELYSIIASVLRESGNKCKISVRDVSNRRKTDISEKFYGNAGFPDFVVLERKKDSNAKKYGCIEIKMPTISLDKNDIQLEGHIQTFKKVLYTNGIRWIFYENGKDNKVFDETLGYVQENTIVWNSLEHWKNLIGELESIYWY